MGRPPLNRKTSTVKTTLRFTKGFLDRVEAIVGKRRVAAFIRAAAEAELERRENLRPKDAQTDKPETDP